MPFLLTRLCTAMLLGSTLVGWKNSPPAASPEAPPPANMPNTVPAPPNAVPNAAPAPAVDLENQRREANEALQQGQQARPAV